MSAEGPDAAHRGPEPVYRFAILGPLVVERDGVPLEVGGPRQQLLLGILLLAMGKPVSSDRLIEQLWTETPNERAAASLHVSVAKLRRSLSPEGGHHDSVLRTVRPGYLVAVDDLTLDLLQLRRLAECGRQEMVAEDFEAASQHLRTALALRRGPLLGDIAEVAGLREEATHVERLLLSIAVDACQCDLRLGRDDEAVAGLTRLTEQAPFDERICAMLMFALYRSGRQADALDAARRLRSALQDELGIEPGPEITRLEMRILKHDPMLASPGHRREELDALSTMVRSSAASPEAALRLGDQRIPVTRVVTTIGRRADRSVSLVDPDVSRHHAEIRRTVAGFVLVDVGSTNGTQVNGRRVAEHLLADGDVIELGATTIVFEDHAVAPRAAGARLRDDTHPGG